MEIGKYVSIGMLIVTVVLVFVWILEMESNRSQYEIREVKTFQGETKYCIYHIASNTLIRNFNTLAEATEFYKECCTNNETK